MLSHVVQTMPRSFQIIHSVPRPFFPHIYEQSVVNVQTEKATETMLKHGTLKQPNMSYLM
jgi:hypothetical protein